MVDTQRLFLWWGPLSLQCQQEPRAIISLRFFAALVGKKSSDTACQLEIDLFD